MIESLRNYCMVFSDTNLEILMTKHLRIRIMNIKVTGPLAVLSFKKLPLRSTSSTKEIRRLQQIKTCNWHFLKKKKKKKRKKKSMSTLVDTLVDFPPYSTRMIAFVTSCFLHTNPHLKKGSTLKGKKKLLPRRAHSFFLE